VLLFQPKETTTMIGDNQFTGALDYAKDHLLISNDEWRFLTDSTKAAFTRATSDAARDALREKFFKLIIAKDFVALRALFVKPPVPARTASEQAAYDALDPEARALDDVQTGRVPQGAAAPDNARTGDEVEEEEPAERPLKVAAKPAPVKVAEKPVAKPVAKPSGSGR
jgi:hypothetical protein